MVNIGRKFLIMANKLLVATDALNTVSKKALQKIAEATDDLFGNKISDKTTKVSTTSPQNSSKTVIIETKNIEHDREIYIYRKKDKTLLMI